MRLTSFIAAGGLAVTVFLSAGSVLDLTTAHPAFPGTGAEESDISATFALAPISIGHPAAAATLKTRRLHRLDPDTPAPVRPTLTEHHKIRSGDILAKVLKRAGVTGEDADAAIRAFAKTYDPRRLKIGQEILVRFQAQKPGAEPTALGTASGKFVGFSFDPNVKTRITVRLLEDGRFEAENEVRELQRTFVRRTGAITTSLYVAGKKADLPNSVLADLIRIYSWDVDFQRDIQRGDAFDVMYEEYRDEEGRFVHAGKIHYASMQLSGDQRPLYRFVTEQGRAAYFDDRGQGAQKALMRTPIDGARLSSGYGKRRHPILGYTKLHRGVDFAAPSGTPIYAAGDGTVVKAGRNGAYGKYIRIRHNGQYSTAYAHMRAIAKGVRGGKRVRQGQIIGYVGTTGRSTGPHLHYEILVNGRHANPMRVKMPSGEKLAGSELKRFMEAKARIDRRTAGLEGAAVQVADTAN